jgi:serine/threonine protein kinase
VGQNTVNTSSKLVSNSIIGGVFDGLPSDDLNNLPGELRLRADGAKNIESILRVYKIDEAELPVCASFLRAMLQLNPAERATAQELLQHEWLKA